MFIRRSSEDVLTIENVRASTGFYLLSVGVIFVYAVYGVSLYLKNVSTERLINYYTEATIILVILMLVFINIKTPVFYICLRFDKAAGMVTVKQRIFLKRKTNVYPLSDIKGFDFTKAADDESDITYYKPIMKVANHQDIPLVSMSETEFYKTMDALHNFLSFLPHWRVNDARSTDASSRFVAANRRQNKPVQNDLLQQSSDQAVSRSTGTISGFIATNQGKDKPVRIHGSMVITIGEPMPFSIRSETLRMGLICLIFMVFGLPVLSIQSDDAGLSLVLSCVGLILFLFGAAFGVIALSLIFFNTYVSARFDKITGTVTVHRQRVWRYKTMVHPLSNIKGFYLEKREDSESNYTSYRPLMIMTNYDEIPLSWIHEAQLEATMTELHHFLSLPQNWHRFK